ncbi:hypothetical protein HYV49_02235 [Candidatus Pacearchaeota archaeon]|nr:hypothetical protein [Candidatus Pacearchaeota archaeon]
MTIVDSSVLIHLLRIGKLSLLKDFFKTIKITEQIHDEIKAGKHGASEFEEACKHWILINKKNFNEAKEISKLESIEEADASIILLAKEQKEILLSNDYALIKVARIKGVECWWLTTFLLECLKKKIMSKKETKQTLLELIGSGMRLKNEVYAALLEQIESM